METVYRLNHTSKATGKDTVIAESINMSDLRKEAAKLLLTYKNNHANFVIIEKGRQWELIEPFVCKKCPDDAGILTISEMIPELQDNNCYLWS